MRDVSRKVNTLRTAIAEATVTMSPKSILALRGGTLPKGDPLPIAKVAAIQAAKSTSQLIPYCHPIPLDFVGVAFEVLPGSIVVRVEVKTIWKTGVEMEALAGASVAALTIYDMLKPIDEDLAIEKIHLLSKTGGKSDFQDSLGRPVRAAVLVLSDSVAAGAKQDSSGKAIVERLSSHGIEVATYDIVPDDTTSVADKLRMYCDELGVDLVLTTGSTGLGQRDIAPEALAAVMDREIPGIAEILRHHGQERTPRAMLSRGLAGQRKKTIIVTLPGSLRAVEESLDVLFPHLIHAFRMIEGEPHAEPTDRSIKSIV